MGAVQGFGHAVSVLKSRRYVFLLGEGAAVFLKKDTLPVRRRVKPFLENDQLENRSPCMRRALPRGVAP
jgi:hypothetical protein